MQKVIIGLYVCATAGALVMLKVGSKDGAIAQLVNGRLEFNLTTYTIFGILSYGISFILYMYLISKFDLGYIIPLTTALVYILVFIASFTIFHESFTLLKIIAICLILIGVSLLNISSRPISSENKKITSINEKYNSEKL